MTQQKVSFTIRGQIHGLIDSNEFVIYESIMWSANTQFEIVNSINKYVTLARIGFRCLANFRDDGQAGNFDARPQYCTCTQVARFPILDASNQSSDFLAAHLKRR